MCALQYGYTARKGSSAVLTDPSGAAEPYQPSWGNYGPDSRGECGAFTARRFHMPNYKGRRSNAPFWYGFDYGSVHFTVISTEHSLVPGSRQYEWLEDDLAAVDRWASMNCEAAPWHNAYWVGGCQQTTNTAAARSQPPSGSWLQLSAPEARQAGQRTSRRQCAPVAPSS